MLEILIVDDDAAVRAAIVALLADLPWLQVVGAAASVAECLAAASRLEPSVVLMDVGLPDGDGFTATERLLCALPGLRVVVLSGYDRPGYVRRALGAGAVAFVAKRRLHVELEPVLQGFRKDVDGNGQRR